MRKSIQTESAAIRDAFSRAYRGESDAAQDAHWSQLGLFASMGVATVLVAPLFAAAGVFGWQILGWLMTGSWVPVSVLDAMIRIGLGSDWAQSPGSWLGVWMAFDWLSAPAGVVMLYMVLFLGIRFSE